MKSREDKFKKDTNSFHLQIALEMTSLMIDLRAFKELLRQNKDTINSLQKEFNSKLSELQNENKENFDLWLKEEQDRYFSDFPRILNNSLFTTLYAYFEFKLLSACNLYSKKFKTKNIGIGDAREFLDPSDSKKENIVDFSEIEKEWGKIYNDFREIRNAIIHDYNQIHEKKVEEIVLKYKSIDKDYDCSQFFISENFILDFINCIDRVLNHIYASLRDLDASNKD